jgi:hypothetical protein
MTYEQDQLATADTDFSLASTAKEEYQYDEGMRVYPHRIGMKQGHKFCGGCCDMRRAVIIVNIVNASLLALGFLSILTIAGASSGGATDDDLEDAIVGFDDAGFIVVLAVTAAKILFSFIGMYGAFRFDVSLLRRGDFVFPNRLFSNDFFRFPPFLDIDGRGLLRGLRCGIFIFDFDS